MRWCTSVSERPVALRRPYVTRASGGWPESICFRTVSRKPSLTVRSSLMTSPPCAAIGSVETGQLFHERDVALVVEAARLGDHFLHFLLQHDTDELQRLSLGKALGLEAIVVDLGLRRILRRDLVHHGAEESVPDGFVFTAHVLCLILRCS